MLFYNVLTINSYAMLLYTKALSNHLIDGTKPNLDDPKNLDIVDLRCFSALSKTVTSCLAQLPSFFSLFKLTSQINN